jgi:hypothetical protein
MSFTIALLILLLITKTYKEGGGEQVVYPYIIIGIFINFFIYKLNHLNHLYIEKVVDL